MSVQLKKMTEAGVVNVTQKVDVSTSQNSSEIDTLLEVCGITVIASAGLVD